MKSLLFLFLTTCLLISAGVSADISLTVYNTDMAIVKILDSMNFKKGIQTISFTDVADRIDPTSVRFYALNGDVTVIEQNYRYDLVNSRKVLERYIDREVTLFVRDGETIEGVLQSVSGDVVLKGRDDRVNIVRVDAIERYDLPELPDGLITRPTLFWKLDSSVAGKADTEVSYITGGFFWHAEYTAVVSENEKSMEMSSWVSIDNRSGASYENAELKLVAGDIHRVTPKEPVFERKMIQARAEDEITGRRFEERELFEYHLYDLGRRTDVYNAEIKQIALFEPIDVKAGKNFIYDYRKNAKKVSVNMEFENSEKDGLGIALPAGKVRVYKRDTDGAIEFVGEDLIDHTPKNEKVRLMLGYAFDIAAERRITDTRRISSRVREQTVEISLRNRKTVPVSITAVEHLWGDWEILRKSHDYNKKDAYTAEFTVDVPADSETKVTYTVRLR